MTVLDQLRQIVGWLRRFVERLYDQRKPLVLEVHVSGLQRWQGLADLGRELVEAFHLAVEALLTSQRLDGVVVVVADGVEGASQLAEALGHGADLVVDLARLLADFPRLGVAALDHPQVGDGTQNGNQGGVRDQHDAFLVAVLE